jgi:DNA polymerase/3'-5' exonuclease PolX
MTTLIPPKNETVLEKLARLKAAKGATPVNVPSTPAKTEVKSVQTAAPGPVVPAKSQLPSMQTTSADKAKAASKLIPAASIATAQELEARAPTPPPPNLTSLQAIQGFDAEKFLHTLEEFKVKIEEKAPGIANYLKDIHSNLNQYQELAHLLTDEQLGLIVSGFFHITDTKMAEVVVKSRKTVASLDENIKLFG